MCRLGACKLQPPDSPHRQRFGAVRSIGTRTSIIPAALPAREKGGGGGALHTSYLELEHSTGASLA